MVWPTRQKARTLEVCLTFLWRWYSVPQILYDNDIQCIDFLTTMILSAKNKFSVFWWCTENTAPQIQCWEHWISLIQCFMHKKSRPLLPIVKRTTLDACMTGEHRCQDTFIRLVWFNKGLWWSRVLIGENRKRRGGCRVVISMIGSCWGPMIVMTR